MRDVVLLFARDCPCVPDARSNLMQAFAEAGIEPSWREIHLDDATTPEAWRHFGSPTILVDGRDVVETERNDGACCRVYGAGMRAPAVSAIARSLRLPGLASRLR